MHPVHAYFAAAFAAGLISGAALFSLIMKVRDAIKILKEDGQLQTNRELLNDYELLVRKDALSPETAKKRQAILRRMQ